MYTVKEIDVDFGNSCERGRGMVGIYGSVLLKSVTDLALHDKRAELFLSFCLCVFTLGMCFIIALQISFRPFYLYIRSLHCHKNTGRQPVSQTYQICLLSSDKQIISPIPYTLTTRY